MKPAELREHILKLRIEYDENIIKIQIDLDYVDYGEKIRNKFKDNKFSFKQNIKFLME